MKTQTNTKNMEHKSTSMKDELISVIGWNLFLLVQISFEVSLQLRKKIYSIRLVQLNILINYTAS